VNMRVAAIAAVTTCGGARALPRLMRMLKDASWEVRREAVKALGRLGDATAVESLCRTLRDHDHDVREAAAVVLGRIADPRSIRPLALTLLDDESFVRNAAYNALMDINPSWEKTPEAQSALPQIKAALKYRGYWINQSVARLLEQEAPEAPVAEEAAMAPVPENPQKDYFPAPQTPPGLPPAAFAILAEMLGDRDRDLRLAAAEAFCQARDRNAVSILAAALQDKDPFVSGAVERALTTIN